MTTTTHSQRKREALEAWEAARRRSSHLVDSGACSDQLRTARDAQLLAYRRLIDLTNWGAE